MKYLMQVGNLSQLEILDMCGNNLREFPKGINSLERLSQFECAGNKLKTLSDLSNLQMLEKLHISGNKLSKILDFRQNNLLDELELSNNDFTHMPKLFHQLDCFCIDSLIEDLEKEIQENIKRP